MISIQDQILRQLISSKSKANIFTTNGFQVNGVITHFDRFSILVNTEKGFQLMYKHAISTITCGQKVRITLDSKSVKEDEDSEDEDDQNTQE